MNTFFLYIILFLNERMLSCLGSFKLPAFLFPALPVGLESLDGAVFSFFFSFLITIFYFFFSYKIYLFKKKKKKKEPKRSHFGSLNGDY